jgi:hypothetical protein
LSATGGQKFAQVVVEGLTDHGLLPPENASAPSQTEFEE